MICYLSATELALRLRRKELSAREVLDAHLRQIETINPKVNAIVTLVPDQAMDRARQLDEEAAHNRFLGPLHGLPIAHKDLVETKGIRTTFGSPIFQNYVPDFNTLLVDRIQHAGAVTIGKTNTPEFGAGSQTFNPVFGATRNPWDLNKTCGGSSGGAAVSLACGMLPIADGSDMGGSLRNPAAFCSVVGFRPSPGRVPRVPTIDAWNPLSVLGPMARTVEDVALFFSAIAGPDPRSPQSIPEPGARFAQPLDRYLKGINVCATTLGLPFDPAIRPIFAQNCTMLESLGCIVEPAEPDFSGADEAFKTLRALSFYTSLHARVAPDAPVKATVREELERGAALTAPKIAQAEILRSLLVARLADFMTRYDYLVLPTTQVPPFDITQEYVPEIDCTKMHSYIDWMQSCYFISITSLPAISVPAGFTPEGLPVGLQIVGRHHDDFGVLQMAHAFAQAANLSGRPPIV